MLPSCKISASITPVVHQVVACHVRVWLAVVSLGLPKPGKHLTTFEMLSIDESHMNACCMSRIELCDHTTFDASDPRDWDASARGVYAVD